MMTEYATSQVAHRALTKLLAPWFLEHGWRQRPGSSCAFLKDSPSRCWCLWIQLGAFGDSLSGNSFTLNLVRQKTSDAPLCGGADGRVLSDLQEADRKLGRMISAEIAAKIPVPPPGHRIHDWAAQPGKDGEHWRSVISNLQTANLTGWKRGGDVWLNYYSVEDLQKWVEFLMPRLEFLLSRTTAA